MACECRNCNQEIIHDDLYHELCAQADALGEESLTELGQELVNGHICEECYYEG